MRYLLMIYAEETRENAMTDAEMGELMDGYYKFGAEAAAAGVMVGGERLKPISTATSVSTEGGDFTVTDGPFAETKEQLGGYYMIDVPSLDEAISWAKKIPGARMGTVEVRPIWSMDDDQIAHADGTEREGAAPQG